MKTTITARSNNRVSIRGPHAALEIWAPATGGYVRYETHHGDKQLCDRLSRLGSTLFWDGTYPLIDLVRREYRAMRAARRRDERRYGRMNPHFRAALWPAALID